ncbi:MAG: hypothetical protein LUB61_01815 [Eggerthellaceae bacterium]|nr:hypothetical protein [Eggerthellaceae bacterium]
MKYGIRNPRSTTFNEKTIYRKARSFKDGTDEISRPGHERTVLKKGFQGEEPYKNLGTDIIFEKNVSVQMREGALLYVDLLRPDTN